MPDVPLEERRNDPAGDALAALGHERDAAALAEDAGALLVIVGGAVRDGPIGELLHGDVAAHQSPPSGLKYHPDVASELKIDRTGWPSGPWDAEPDLLAWTTEAGLPGLILRTDYGSLNGYVGLPIGHRAIGVAREDFELEVHGGVTFAGAEPPQGVDGGDAVWWVGFDCAHAWDRKPGYEARLEALVARHGGPRLSRLISRSETYRDIAYVRGEVEHLAAQLGVIDAARSAVAAVAQDALKIKLAPLEEETNGHGPSGTRGGPPRDR